MNLCEPCAMLGSIRRGDWWDATYDLWLCADHAATWYGRRLCGVVDVDTGRYT